MGRGINTKKRKDRVNERGVKAGMKRELGESGDSGGVEMKRRGGGVRVGLGRERSVEARKTSRE